MFSGHSYTLAFCVQSWGQVLNYLVYSACRLQQHTVFLEMYNTYAWCLCHTNASTIISPLL